MRILLASLVATIFLSSVHGQGCFGVPPMQPTVPCSTQLKPLCLCAGVVGSCHWQWACPSTNRATEVQPATQTYQPIPLGYQPPKFNDPADTMRKIEEIRQMREQTELLRQQTEALRQQNQQSQQQGQPVATQPSLYGQPIDYGALAKQPGDLPAPAGAPTLIRHGESAPTAPPTLIRREGAAPPLNAAANISGNGYQNGHAWLSFTPRERIIYLQSMMEGMASVGAATNSMPQVRTLFPDALTPAQLAAKLDEFYSPGSEAITVVDALRILAKE
jgi:hypothetical protein